MIFSAPRICKLFAHPNIVPIYKLRLIIHNFTSFIYHQEQHRLHDTLTSNTRSFVFTGLSLHDSWQHKSTTNLVLIQGSSIHSMFHGKMLHSYADSLLRHRFIFCLRWFLITVHKAAGFTATIRLQHKSCTKTKRTGFVLGMWI